MEDQRSDDVEPSDMNFLSTDGATSNVLENQPIFILTDPGTPIPPELLTHQNLQELCGTPNWSIADLLNVFSADQQPGQDVKSPPLIPMEATPLPQAEYIPSAAATSPPLNTRLHPPPTLPDRVSYSQTPCTSREADLRAIELACERIVRASASTDEQNPQRVTLRSKRALLRKKKVHHGPVLSHSISRNRPTTRCALPLAIAQLSPGTPPPPPTPPTPAHDSCIKMRDGTLHVRFPLNGPFRCPQWGCLKAFQGAGSWRNDLNCLTKHLAKTHNVSPADIQSWCCLCRSKINDKPSLHRCLIGRKLREDEEFTPKAKCPYCKYQTSYQKGMRNHIRRHERGQVAPNPSPDPTGLSVPSQAEPLAPQVSSPIHAALSPAHPQLPTPTSPPAPSPRFREECPEPLTEAPNTRSPIRLRPPDLSTTEDITPPQLNLHDDPTRSLDDDDSNVIRGRYNLLEVPARKSQFGPRDDTPLRSNTGDPQPTTVEHDATASPSGPLTIPPRVPSPSPPDGPLLGSPPQQVTSPKPVVLTRPKIDEPSRPAPPQNVTSTDEEDFQLVTRRKKRKPRPTATPNQQHATPDPPPGGPSPTTPPPPASTCPTINPAPDTAAPKDARIRLSGRELHLWFPVPAVFECPLRNCNKRFRSAKSWSAAKQSLHRHIEQSHEWRIEEEILWCTFCNQKISARPSDHHCLVGHQLRDNVPNNLRFVCQRCRERFPSRKGLFNHLKTHTRSDALANQPDLPIPDTGRRTQPPPRIQDPDVDHDQPPTQRTPPAQRTPGPSPVVVDQWPPPSAEQRGTPSPPTHLSPGSPPAPAEEEPQVDPAPDLHIPIHITDWPDDVEDEDTPEGDIEHNDPATDPTNADTPIPSLAAYAEPLDSILGRVPSEESWNDFESLLSTIFDDIRVQAKVPPPRPPGGRPPPINTDDARALQKLYRRNRRRAVRAILSGNSQTCTIPPEEIQQHFQTIWNERPFRDDIYNTLHDRPPVSLDPLSEEEVARALGRAENTAPGQDQITYNAWREIDPNAKTLARVFNICLAHRRIPDSWRTSRTVLIPKGNNPTSISDWRPISLSSTIYKLFTKCLTARVSTWIAANGVLSAAQKGFTPHDGVFEHNFVLQTTIQRARTEKKPLCIAWLDCSNAFGSLPHGAVVKALESAGAGEHFVDIAKQLYSNTTTQIATGSGDTPPIPILAGIRQGCPLSGLLFNIAVDPILRSIQPDSASEVSALAYADDIVVLSTSPAELQEKIRMVETGLADLAISLNPKKSAVLAYSPQKPAGPREVDIFINNQRTRCLKMGDTYRFLGKPTGIAALPCVEDMKEYVDQALLILRSKLAPWQRLDALKSFFFPALQHPMRTGQFRKGDWGYLDRVIRAEVKKTLYLPQEAANEYLHGPSKMGCLAIPLAAEESDLCLAANAFKLLTSQDQRIRTLAVDDLSLTIRKRLKREIDDGDVSRYLSGETSEELHLTSNAISSTWTAARMASHRLGIKWTIQGQAVSATYGEVAIYERQRSALTKLIRNKKRNERAETLHKLKSQGKAMECVALDPSSSYFLGSGEYMRFADWRFVHRARLNLLPLNGTKSWKTQANQGCRRCNHPKETLPHVLQHCMRFSTSIKQRHAAILSRLKKAASYRHRILSCEQEFGDRRWRPDLVIKRGRDVTIFDVTIPFDNRPEALKEARRKKLEKYAELADSLSSRYQSVTVQALVVGALGSWDPANDKALRPLTTRRYLKKFKQLCVADVIRHSRDLYFEFLTGKKPTEQQSAATQGSNPIATAIPHTQPPTLPPTATNPLPRARSLSPLHRRPASSETAPSRRRSL